MVFIIKGIYYKKKKERDREREKFLLFYHFNII